MVVPSAAFVPRPRVDAAVVRFVKRSDPVLAFDELKFVTDKMFLHPRKMLARSLRDQGILGINSPLPSCIPSDARPGALRENQIIELARCLRQRAVLTNIS
jgi:16S rRNA A1518/A1519 N6-dimethyltransferase RsmA/KsgA/DIM1 with predicted DNA glycosylase/AP lyase activity